MINYMRKIVKSKNFNFFVVLFYSLILIFPYLFWYIRGDDTIFHLINIDIYSKIPTFSKIVPIYANNLGWGVGIFYPSLPHALGGIILKIVSIFHFGNVLAIKLEKILIIIFSGICMYILASKVYNDKTKGMIGAILYLSSSYFFVDLYMRDALNEAMIFVFVPVVFLSLYYLFIDNNKKMFFICFIVGYIGMIYSHLLLTMWFTIMLIPFLAFNLKRLFKKEKIKAFIISIFIIIGLTSTFIFPLLEHMMANKWFIPAYKLAWVLPIRGYIVPDYYKTSSSGLLFINFSHIQIILFIISVINLLFNRKYKYDKKYLAGILSFSIISVVISSQMWFWELIPKFFSNIQFAWRLTAFSTFGVCLFSLNGLDSIYNLFKNKYKYMLTIIIIISSLSFSLEHLNKVNFLSDIGYIDDYKNGFSTKDYFPNNAIINFEKIEKYNPNELKILRGNAKYKIIKNNVPSMKFNVFDINDKVEIELPRFYYLGYQILDQNGEKINYEESEIGLIKTTISNEGEFELKYRGTNIYIMSVFLKIMTITIIILKSMIT